VKRKFTHERLFVICGLIILTLAIFYSDYRRSDFFDSEESFFLYAKNTLRSWVSGIKPETKLRASYVIDGDTFELTNGERVRLIGIDAPESGSPGFSDARNLLEQRIKNKDIQLQMDTTKRDDFGRLLLYVWVQDELINKTLVSSGWARIMPIAPDTRYADELKEAQLSAQNASLGLWGTQATQAGPIVVTDFHPNAEGIDTDNLNDEYVVLHNVTSKKIDVSDWKVSDDDGNEYIFSSFVINSGAKIYLYSGEGEQTPLQLYWGRKNTAVWNNTGDTLIISDSTGETILTYTY